MDYAKALTFITEDPRWKEKIAIGGGVALISILLPFILIGVIGFLIISGYAVRLLVNVRDGKTHPLPEWDAWGDDLRARLQVLEYMASLPAIIFHHPLTVGGMLTEGGGSAETVGGIIVFWRHMPRVALQPVCRSCFARLHHRLRHRRAHRRSPVHQNLEPDAAEHRPGRYRRHRDHRRRSIAISSAASPALCCVSSAIATLPLIMLITTIHQFHIYGQLAYAFPYDGIYRLPVAAHRLTPDAGDLAVTPAVPETPVQPEMLAGGQQAGRTPPATPQRKAH